jgi:hypothetical protein
MKSSAQIVDFVNGKFRDKSVLHEACYLIDVMLECQENSESDEAEETDVC